MLAPAHQAADGVQKRDRVGVQRAVAVLERDEHGVPCGAGGPLGDGGRGAEVSRSADDDQRPREGGRERGKVVGLPREWREPRRQRPEMWTLLNGRLGKGETVRVFPLSNWTEGDVWRYIALEKLDVVPLYFAAPRKVVNRDGQLIMVDDERMRFLPGETPELRTIRFRTLGCWPLTAAVESDATDLDAVIEEVLSAKYSERAGRLIDHDQAGAMEMKKREGYF